MTVFLNKYDENGKRISFDGKRVTVAKGKNKWKFFQEIIDNSGLTIDELNKFKPKKIMEMIYNHKDSLITPELVEQYEYKPFIHLFKRVLKYNRDFDINKVARDGDNLSWWCSTASDESKLACILSDRYSDSWTTAMRNTFSTNIDISLLLKVFEAVQPEDWNTDWGKETEEQRNILSKNNRLLDLINLCTSTIIANNYEVFLAYYDKMVRIWLNRTSRVSKITYNIRNIVRKFRGIDVRAYVSLVTTYETYDELRERFAGRWDSIPPLLYVDTDTKKFFKRSLEGRGKTKEEIDELYHSYLVYGRLDYRGPGIPSSQTSRMGLWQTI